MRRGGAIRSVEAGVIVHQERGHCAFGTSPGEWPMRGVACCPYAGNDGRLAMKRLMEAGLAIRGPRPGTWIMAPREGGQDDGD